MEERRAVMLNIEVLVSCIQHEKKNKWLALPRLKYDDCICMALLIAADVSPRLAFETNYIYPARPVFPGEHGDPALWTYTPFSVQKARVSEPHHYSPSYKLALTPSRANGALVQCARRACT
jgi:hypothetical protein